MTDYSQYASGSIHHGFRVERVEYIEDIQSTVLLFTHVVLGCQALAIKNEDSNKTFCVSFLTVPQDSTGVAHILEHAVLMGSRKYPVKDVFGEINKGGLLTFLNAMTGADTTWYPFATRNLKEYFNIMDVYCDVVFHPLLLRSTFEQEGWHHHLEDEQLNPQFMGVVFNEMKGAYSDPIRSLFHDIHLGLMPDSTYAHESGGDPRRIPDLSYEQFKTFHAAHYHPSNSTFFFYGDAPLEQELAYVQEHFLSQFTSPSTKADIKVGKLPSQPVYIDDSYPVQPGGSLEGKTFIAVSSAVANAEERERNAAFQIIANILFNSDGSPLKREIVNAGLCKDFGGLCMANNSPQTLMVTYLIGSDARERDRFLKLYKKTLTQMVEASLDRDLVLSELNKFEFGLREEMNKAQRGLSLIGKAMSAMKYGLSPFEEMRSELLFAAIRKRALQESWFERLIRSALLENPATVVVTLQPDPVKMQQNQQEEEERLASYAQSLSQGERRQLVDHTRELIALQLSQPSESELQRLPRLSRSELEPRPLFHQVEAQTLAGAPLLISELPTNGIVYFDIGFDCGSLSAEELLYLDIFGTILTEIGTRDKDYMRFATELNRRIGNFSHSFHAYLRLDAWRQPKPMLWLQVKALSSSLPEALELVIEVLQAADFSDRRRIEEIVQREYAWAEHNAASEGYSLAALRAFSHLSLAGKYSEYVHGMAAYQQLKQLASNYARLEAGFLASLARIRELLFNRAGVVCSITAEQDAIQRFQSLGQGLIQALPQRPLKRVRPAFSAFPANQAFTNAAEIVYNVQTCNLFAEPQTYSGDFEVLKTWLSRDYLWNTVRQMGGAYGCFIQFNHLSGNFGMVSYRDPQVSKTYEAYQALPELIRSFAPSKESLEQLILGAYNSALPHQGPAAKGAIARNDYLSGISAAFRQQKIEEILDASPESLRAFAPRFEALRQTDAHRVSLGNKEKIEQDAALFDQISEV